MRDYGAHMQRYALGDFLAAIFLIFVTMGFTLSCNNYSLLDSLENPGGKSAKAGCQGGSCRIFISQQQVYGNVTISGADAACNFDTNTPINGKYKAMLVAGTTRQACSTANCQGGVAEHIDWVLYANQAYVKPDGSAIGTTDASGIFTTLSSGIGGSYTVWTGLTTDWTSNSSNCSGWTSNAGGFGMYGTGNGASVSNVISTSTDYCSNSRSLYCVEQ